MEKIELADNLKLSQIVHGHWRLLDWNLSNNELLRLIEQVIDLGVTSFDHADIYGNYGCEKAFGDILKNNNINRNNLQIITKCGIKLVSDKFPKQKIKYYDYSYNHIISSVENSLSNFRTDYIDLLLLHRPSPFFNPQEVAKAFSSLKQSGKVLHFGVSNFNLHQFEMLDSYLDDRLLTNQVEISPNYLDHFENGNIDFFLKKRIKPLAWSPLAGGKLLSPVDTKEERIHNCLSDIADELGIDSIDKIIYAWLFKHPAGIIPVIGTAKISRIKRAIEALNVDLTIEQWFRIYNSSTGEDLP